MCYNFVADSFHIKTLCSRLFSSEVRFYMENSLFAVLNLLGCLDTTYDDHLGRLIGKFVLDFLLVLIELFCMLPLSHYERISTKNRRFRSNTVSLTKNFR